VLKAILTLAVVLSACFAAAWAMGAAGAIAGAEGPPAARFVISSYGAVGDGKTVNTKAIQRAIDSAAAGGGGTVVVPSGVFVTGAIFLRPGVGLFVEKDGVLKGSTDIADFPMRRTRIEGHFQPWAAAMVNAEGVDHLRIGGAGTLDGSGTPFYAAFRSRVKDDDSTANLDVPRPRMIYLSHCSDVRVEGLHLLNSAFWNVHVYHCQDVVIDGLDINCPAKSPSTDGVDIDSSQRITIHGCRIANNDDGIALKGSKGARGPGEMDEADNPPVEQVHIYDCIFDHSGSMLTCGSEATVVRDVEVDHCSTAGRGPSSMLRLKLRTDTQQLYEKIRFHDITLGGNGSVMKGSVMNISSWDQYEDLQGHAPPTHVVRDVSISNVKGSVGSFGVVEPIAGDRIENLTLENIDLTVARGRVDLKSVVNLVVKNVKVNGIEIGGERQ
jgi:alpha-L-rhamnosidase